MYAQNSILCQFGNLEICPNFANPYLTQFSSISGGNCIKSLSKLLAAGGQAEDEDTNDTDPTDHNDADINAPNQANKALQRRK